MENCSVTDSKWGIVAFDESEMKITGSEFRELENGIALSWSRLEISDTAFMNITGNAIKSPFKSELISEDLTYENVGDEVVSSMDIDVVFLSVCNSMVVLLWIITVVSIVVIYRKIGRLRSRLNEPNKI